MRKRNGGEEDAHFSSSSPSSRAAHFAPKPFPLESAAALLAEMSSIFLGSGCTTTGIFCVILFCGKGNISLTCLVTMRHIPLLMRRDLLSSAKEEWKPLSSLLHLLRAPFPTRRRENRICEPVAAAAAAAAAAQCAYLAYFHHERREGTTTQGSGEMNKY